MIPGWWSWFLVAWSCSGLFIAAKQPRIGWLWLVLSVVPWNLYAWQSDQMGFLAGNFVYGAVYLRNWWVSRDGTR